jgi:hypothetical protein
MQLPVFNVCSRRIPATSGWPRPLHTSNAVQFTPAPDACMHGAGGAHATTVHVGKIMRVTTSTSSHTGERLAMEPVQASDLLEHWVGLHLPGPSVKVGKGQAHLLPGSVGSVLLPPLLQRGGGRGSTPDNLLSSHAHDETAGPCAHWTLKRLCSAFCWCTHAGVSHKWLTDASTPALLQHASPAPLASTVTPGKFSASCGG